MQNPFHYIFFSLFQAPPGSFHSVAKLAGEDLLKKKNYDMRTRRLASKARVLRDKHQAIMAELEANRSEFWDGIYESCGLPSDLNYKIDEDGQVFKFVPPPAQPMPPLP